VDEEPVEGAHEADKGFEAELLLSLPDKPSIAVLPFTNLSGDRRPVVQISSFNSIALRREKSPFRIVGTIAGS
jgi:hypothetical protein